MPKYDGLDCSIAAGLGFVAGLLVACALAGQEPANVEMFHRDAGPIGVPHRIALDLEGCRRGVVRWSALGASIRPVARIGLVPRAVAAELTWKTVPVGNVAIVRARVEGGSCAGREAIGGFIVTPPLPKAGKPYRWWRAKRRANPPWRHS
ncbi:MAG TPA: hypothetical protein VJ725_07295 [Thermoanaerobaculia bacterium]|nr:hypothetical protein [Thermoanaerobaculia bacterium]